MNRIVLIIVPIIWAFQLWGQSTKLPELQYISPKPGSKFIMPGNNIALRYGQPLDAKSLSPDLLDVKNESGKRIVGELKLSTDQKTLIYKPYDPFPLGKTIMVELKNGLKTISDMYIQPVKFEFTITNKIIPPPKGFMTAYYHCGNEFQDNIRLSKNEKLFHTKENNLPDGFPNINITISNDPSTDEYIFFAPWTYSAYTFPFLIISDVYGTPIYYRKADATVRDFKVQRNGYLSFTMIDMDQLYRNIVMDSTYQFVDFFQIGNGYSQTDPHDFQLLENGNAYVIAIDWQLVAMDTVVPGGLSSALVGGFIVQEQDPDKNVIFQWRSWDHFLITDAGPQIDLTGYIIDYVHGNAVEVESDTSILISSRSMDEITKIHRNTGEIIWRFGGKNNQFNVQNDTLGFTMQHDCRRLSNGHITLFDNGTMQPEPQFSSALEYEMDEENLEATLIQRLRNDPDIYGNAMGNAQWKNDHSVIVGWGNGNPGITEFSPDGEVKLEIQFQGVSYRAFRFPWETNYFLMDTDTLQYGFIWHESTLTKELMVTSNTETTIELSSYYSRGDVFTIENEFPITILQDESIVLQVKFSPDSVGLFEDMITINSDTNSDTLIQRIAQQVYLIGNTTEGQNVNNAPLQLKAEIFPNPVFDNVNIQLEKHQVLSKVCIYNTVGKCLVKEEVNSVRECVIDISKLKNGLYFIAIETTNHQSGMFKIIKL